MVNEGYAFTYLDLDIKRVGDDSDMFLELVFENYVNNAEKHVRLGSEMCIRDSDYRADPRGSGGRSVQF